MDVSRKQTTCSHVVRRAVFNTQNCMRLVNTSNRFVCACVLMLFLLSETSFPAQSIRLEDNSDWWSKTNPKFPYVDIKLQDKDIATGNFQIAGFDLKTVEFDQVAAKFGKAKIVERGDASIGRSQACYTSEDSSPSVHLIFEFAEDESIFYLFSRGPDWNGSRLCVKSRKVSLALSIPSGLRLGITQVEVESILGKPAVIRGERYIYNRLVERKVSPQEFEKMRKEYPMSLSNQEAHKKFDTYPTGLYIEVRFSNSKLNYLAVAMTGTSTG